MIGKNVNIGDVVNKSHGARMASLVAYVEQLEQSHDHPRPEICYFNVLSPETGDDEMIALAKSNPRSRQPMRHVVFSWPAGERPTAAQAQEAARLAMKEMGVERCLAKAALHYDTDHLNLHLVICTTDPTTQKMVKTAFIEESIHKAIAIIEHVQCWQPETNTRYSVLKTGELVKNVGEADYEVVRQKALHEKAARLERFSGQRSATDIGKEIVPQILGNKKIDSWKAFHEQLAAHGCEYKRAHGGATIFVRQGDESVGVSASSCNRKAALGAMEKRFGSYQPATAVEVAPRAIEPAPGVAGSGEREELWRQFQAQRTTHKQTQDDYETFRKRQKTEMAALAATQKKQRTEALNPVDRFGQRIALPFDVLTALRSTIAAAAAAERAELKDTQAAQRAQRKGKGKFPDFDKWLTQQGRDDLAQEHINRSGRPELRGAMAVARMVDIRDYQSVVHGRDVHYIGSDKKVAFVDHGQRIALHASSSTPAITAALQLSAEKWSGGFTVNGNVEFKEVVFREAIRLGSSHKIQNSEIGDFRERFAQEQADRLEHERFINAVKTRSARNESEQIHRSSTHVAGAAGTDGRGQKARLDTDRGMRCMSERDLADRGRVAVASDAHLLRRATGATGSAGAGVRRVSTDAADGAARRLVAANKELARESRRAAAHAAPARIISTPPTVARATGMPVSANLRAIGDDSAAIWHAHHSDIMQRMPGASQARIDVMLAQRLRATGHDRNEVAAMVQLFSRHAQASAPHAQRVAETAFDAYSTTTIARASAQHRRWQSMEKAVTPTPTPSPTLTIEQRVDKAMQEARAQRQPNPPNNEPDSPTQRQRRSMR